MAKIFPIWWHFFVARNKDKTKKEFSKWALGDNKDNFYLCQCRNKELFLETTVPAAKDASMHDFFVTQVIYFSVTYN